MGVKYNEHICVSCKIQLSKELHKIKFVFCRINEIKKKKKIRESKEEKGFDTGNKNIQ